MGKAKQINIKNRTYYFYSDMINLKSFKINLLKIDKKNYRAINIYYIGYIITQKIDDCDSIDSVNHLHLLVNHASGCIKEKNGYKYLIFDYSVDEIKELLKNTTMFGIELKTKSKQ